MNFTVKSELTKSQPIKHNWVQVIPKMQEKVNTNQKLTDYEFLKINSLLWTANKSRSLEQVIIWFNRKLGKSMLQTPEFCIPVTVQFYLMFQCLICDPLLNLFQYFILRRDQHHFHFGSCSSFHTLAVEIC